MFYSGISYSATGSDKCKISCNEYDSSWVDVEAQGIGAVIRRNPNTGQCCTFAVVPCENFMNGEPVKCPVQPKQKDICKNELKDGEWTPIENMGKSYVLQKENTCCEVYVSGTNNGHHVWWEWYAAPDAKIEKYLPGKQVKCPVQPKPGPKPNKAGFCEGECSNVCFEKYDGPKDTASYRIYFKYESTNKPNSGCDENIWQENIKNIYTENATQDIDRIIIVGGASCENSTVVRGHVDFVHDLLQSVAPVGEISKLTDCPDNKSKNPDCSQYVSGSATASALGYQFDTKTEGCKYRVVFVHVTFKNNELKRRIAGIINTRDMMADNASKWKTAEGNFNGARLASDSIAGVVLGTAGGLITSSVVKKHQVSSGMENVMCTIGGQSVATYGDEFTVGIK